MKFHLEDEVRFNTEHAINPQKGTGVVVELDMTNALYIVQSSDVIDGINGGAYWCFAEDELELVESCDDTDEIKNISLVTTSNGGKHMDICNQLNKIYLAKNKDYGNSFGEQYQEYGITSSVIRLDDKMRRLKQITKNGTKVENETVEDTLMDMANYAIMTLMEIRGEEKWEIKNGNH